MFKFFLKLYSTWQQKLSPTQWKPSSTKIL